MEFTENLLHLVHNYRVSAAQDLETNVQNIADLINKNLKKNNGKLAPGEIQTLIKQLNEEQFLEYLAPLLDLELLYNFLNDMDKKNIVKDQDQLKDILNFLRRPPLLQLIYASTTIDKWYALTLNFIDKTSFGIWELLEQRRREYPDKVLFQVLRGDEIEKLTYDEAISRIEILGRCLLRAIDGHPPKMVGIFAYNSLEMAMLDLACLSAGIQNAMLPANSSISQLEYMIDHSGADILFIGSEKLYQPVSELLPKLKNVKRVISLNDFVEGKVESLSSFCNNKDQTEDLDWNDICQQVDIKEPATVMYTSGTTGNPKGIIFTIRHMISKRYARAIALSKIGSGDSFLCFLPLFHTFGRYFELQGSIFWGAQYSFVEKPAIEVVLKNFLMVKPSVFISIPKKWKQIYESIENDIDIEVAPEPEIKKLLIRLTGGNLRWGLSAAGYLEPEIFRFYQRHGVSLLSGFGMTEGTGGMLMTPPENYKDNSLGVPLPGIEAKLADDGELLVKGTYVFDEYLHPEKEEAPANEEGWFHTGDIMQMDNDGYYTIIDRKKEIYKNIKGQTVAPQRIENFFREFLSVGHVFLVGDHREYNTVLLYPSYDYEEGYFNNISDEEMRNFFSSLIVSVNRFLAPFERIVNFAILEKDFDPEKELTPKGTFRRKIIEENYAKIIDSLYENEWLSLKSDGIEIRIPNWFLREKGMTADELTISNNILKYKHSDDELPLKYDPDRAIVEIGNFSYNLKGRLIDFDELLLNKELWIGNHSFTRFFGKEVFEIDKMAVVENAALSMNSISQPAFPDEAIFELFADNNSGMDENLYNIHYALTVLFAKDYRGKDNALDFLEKCLSREYSKLRGFILNAYSYLPDFLAINWARRIFKDLMFYESSERFLERVSAIWVSQHEVLNHQTMIDIAERGLEDEKIMQILNFTKKYFWQLIKSLRQDQRARLKSLLEFLVVYTSYHPTLYKINREIVVNYILQDENREVTEFSLHYYNEMEQQFRQWLGPMLRLAVDQETGMEYRWEEVIVFDEDIDFSMRKKLLNAIKENSIIKESIFVINRRNLVQLRDIPQGGVWITALESTDDYACFRASVQTRTGESFDIRINLNLSVPGEELKMHLFWLIIAGETEKSQRLVNEFCGYWEKHGIWTQEYVSAENVGHLINRKIKRNLEKDILRLKNQWANYVWSALIVSIDFWRRTQKRLILADMSYRNFIVPQSDYREGARLVKLEYTKANEGEAGFIRDFWQQYVEAGSKECGDILPEVDPLIIPYAIIEACGKKEGLEFLNNALQDWDKKKMDGVPGNIKEVIRRIVTEKKPWMFYPRKLYFAISRFHRWKTLSENKNPEANAGMLGELFETYRLDQVEKILPDTRVRFFNDTVFSESKADLKEGMLQIIERLLSQDLTQENYIEALTTLRRQYELSEWDEFFLARLTHPYLRPHDSASYVELEEDGKWKTEIVVNCYDSEGEEYVIRGPVNPKEVAKLYQLFMQTDLPVQFRPEHRFLIAVNERGVVIGGLFYYFKSRDSVLMEKIAVKSAFRRKGVSARVIQELFSRLRNIGVNRVSTGFYRPEFFYKFGFKIENKYEGLVKDLTLSEKPAEEEIEG